MSAESAAIQNIWPNNLFLRVLLEAAESIAGAFKICGMF
jgi:hypothetical protein